MKRIALVSIGFLVTAPSCKHEDKTPPLARSASMTSPLASAPLLPRSNDADPESSDFEGEITLLAKGKFAADESNPLELKLQIKAGRVRVAVPDSMMKDRGLGPAYLLVQPQDKKAYAVLESKRQAVLLEFDKLAEQAKSFDSRGRLSAGTAAAKSPPTPPRLERTGKFDTVAGLKCEIWHYSQGKNRGDACIAERETPWFHVPANVAQTPTELSWVTSIADGKHLPLRFVTIEQDVERGRLEVSRVEQKSLPASSFEVPPGYAVVSLEQVIGSMLGGLGGAGLPPNLKLPPGVKLPPGIKLPRASGSE